jgi:acyl-coenzyme A synthetase/AMP-(fatty) acid ligase
MLTSVSIDGQQFDSVKLLELAAGITGRLTSDSSLIVSAADRLAFVAAVLAAEAERLQVIAAPSYWTNTQLQHAIALCRPKALLRVDAKISSQFEIKMLAGSDPPESGIVLFSSGTTGTPKGIQHAWSTISASGQYVPERLRGRIWHIAYEPAGFAGLQVLFAANNSNGGLVMPPAGATFREHAELLAEHRVEVVSATPTWWRMLIAAWPSGIAVPKLLQATLGGEIVDQPTIDLVDRFFKPSHLTHVYATSEAGTAIVVSDRRSGFPQEWLFDLKRTVALRAHEGMLEVKSPFRMRGYVDAAEPSDNDGWLPTGDIIEIRDGRCHFVGRADQRLNIGGSKVTPEEVEEVLQRDPGILDCLVYGRRNPITGTLLAADIVLAKGGHFDAAALRRRLSGCLPPHKVPQHFRVVAEIPTSTNGKKLRV